MKNFLICSLAVICIFSCTKSAPPQEFVGEWKNTDISYYYDNAKLDLAVAPYVDSRSYRIWLWEEDTAMSSLEYSLDAEFRPSFIINSDGSALYGNNSIKATYSGNSISFQIDGKKRSFPVHDNSFHEEYFSSTGIYGYTLTENGERMGYDGKGDHVLKQVITWTKQ